MFLSYCQCHHLPNPKFQNTKPLRIAETRGVQSIRKASTRNIRSLPKLSRNNSWYASLLQHCSRERLLEGGLQLHADMIKSGFDSDTYLRSSLLGLYVRCESLDCVRTLFDTAGSLRTNLVSWNSIITMYFRLGLIEEALSAYLELRRSGFAPDQYTLSVLIGAVQERGDLRLGIQLHCVCVKFGYGEEEFVANSLIKMYAAFGRTDASSRVFEKIRGGSGSSVAWNSMIARHVEDERYEDGLKLYEKMMNVGSATTPLTLSSVLRACAAREQISEGKQVHSQVMVRGFVPNVILETALLEFYSRCGELDDARKVFERTEDKNVLTWNAMIRGYSQEGYIEEAFELFRAMRRGRMVSDKFTFPALLSGAATGEDCEFLQQFRSIHACIIKTGLESDRFVGASLVTMYSRNRRLEEARLAFDDTSSKDIGVWASMISACAKNKQGAQAIALFSEMLLLGVTPGPSVFPSLFAACGELSALEMGKQIHGYGSKNGLLSDSAAQNSLITMYSHCGLLVDARRIFSSVPDPNVVSFNSIISALAQHGHATEAYELSRGMELVGVRPDGVTLLNLLSAFNHAGLVEEGLESFSSMEETYRIEPTYQHYACIVDSLARAGEIDKAFGLIGAMPFEPDASLWRIVLGACAKHGNLETGKRIAEQLVELEPDEATNYVLIANVYARVGRCAEATKIRNVMAARGLQKEEGFSWIEIDRRIYKFGVEDRSHPRSEDIYVGLGELTTEMKAACYVPDVSFTLHDMEAGPAQGKPDKISDNSSA
ncbi:pentatricopeptide repeat-containing protein, mitochondrial-like [Iris pallida]|uniref:Pentatricopeptide repeat-containing protein, mitochondrial-like n=1 Tax=Iris pallida TaxID=29817 RepID=A0AAX6DYW0_IRIPA|nr:pentatricopeptide repeat-containing protein, mitochondrial-like [Iris pallida]